MQRVRFLYTFCHVNTAHENEWFLKTHVLPWCLYWGRGVLCTTSHPHVLGLDGGSAGSFLYAQRMSLFLSSCSWTLADAGDEVAAEWNPLAELYGKIFPVRLLALLPDPELHGSFAESRRLGWGVSVCRDLLLLARGGPWMLCLSSHCAPGCGIPPIPDLWGCLMRLRLLRQETLEQGLCWRKCLSSLSLLCAAAHKHEWVLAPFLFPCVFLSNWSGSFVSSHADELEKEGENWSRVAAFLSLDLESAAIPTPGTLQE